MNWGLFIVLIVILQYLCRSSSRNWLESWVNHAQAADLFKFVAFQIFPFHLADIYLIAIFRLNATATIFSCKGFIQSGVRVKFETNCSPVCNIIDDQIPVLTTYFIGPKL